MYLTKTGIKSGCDRPVEKRAYFLARFFGFAFGVNGSGGLFTSVRNRSFVRRRASAGGRKSIDLSSAACWADGLCLVISVCDPRDIFAPLVSRCKTIGPFSEAPEQLSGAPPKYQSGIRLLRETNRHYL